NLRPALAPSSTTVFSATCAITPGAPFRMTPATTASGKIQQRFISIPLLRNTASKCYRYRAGGDLRQFRWNILHGCSASRHSHHLSSTIGIAKFGFDLLEASPFGFGDHN